MRDHYVYFIDAKLAEKNACKIGYSNNPEQRFRQLQNASPVELVQVVCLDVGHKDNAIMVEREFHNHLS